MEKEAPIPVCGVRAYKPFRDKIGEFLTPCCKTPKHIGKHIYCIITTEGIDDFSYALHFYEELTRKAIEAIAIFEMKGDYRESNYQTCAALWQFMELLNEQRENKNGK